MPKQELYFDNNATTQMDKSVLNAMLPYFTESYANATSNHLFGLSVGEAVDESRENIATFIGAQPKEIIFTSGATESINLAIKGLQHYSKKHIITVTTEHKAVLDTCSFMEHCGFDVTYLPLNKEGLLDLNLLKATIRKDTLLVCVMLANNETGVINPIREISKLARKNNILVMTDATQAIGKLAVDVSDLGIDLMPLSAHKFYGPKGIGALYVSAAAKIKLDSQIHGGGQERKIRSGTLNVPGIIGLGKACEIVSAEMDTNTKQITILRNHLEKELLKIEGTFVNGSIKNRLCNTTNICFPGVNSEKMKLALQNISVSSGSACSAVTTEPSHVLKAIGLSDAEALSSIRFSLSKFTTADEIELVIQKVTQVVAELRQKNN
ncbi:cysteine desulfurase [Flavobacterium tiangeerense]|uniref:cysteine desulfurase n=1 Tax=Flavobacterium tiangeerense TaxID=459471 RepID=A0ABY3FKU3_9FLAO|nr:cysteine desulfurase family protein [Flavobacterium tiangeerense]TWI00587.1 cysteine desulfurase [Flavobacterium tiangeerense]